MAKLRKGPINAAEAMAILNADPEYQAMWRTRDARLQQELQERARIEQPLVDDLNAAGFFVKSVWDLVNTSSPYPRALPILLDHLQRDYPEEVLNGIARAMAVRESKFAWQTLLRLFRAQFGQSSPWGFKDGLAAALSAIADDELMPDVIELFQQPRHGEYRIYFVRTLKRSKHPNAKAALEAGRLDPQLVKEIVAVVDGPKRRRAAKGNQGEATPEG